MIDADRVRGRMAEKHITQKDIGDCLKVSKNTVSAIFAKKRDLKTSEVRQLCDLLEVTEDHDVVAFFMH